MARRKTTAAKTTYIWANSKDDDGNPIMDETKEDDPKWTATTSKGSSTKDTYGNIEAAVDLTIIDPLFITVGFQYKIADKNTLFLNNDYTKWGTEKDDDDKDKDVYVGAGKMPYDMKIAAGAS